ncbi:2-succinyl-6-hydroxy-2,4-cyclohexadiene-1-carboxylate synthase [Cytobacillus sp. IB215665]|uniref:2-succinyl-6-hydroxy-2, 4-cyclohexadiene-1-carboxylate synthase n=1 Tax=Cytobacillus sp. IB215665 TaxID=3097357 RepID=UPI002A0D49AC|nr:2-succinyl-6-hydroxy-2,4-cyclohexadiene-1-carboxylate synthase [Cytobacillus sp. IB215665]MDX8367409.1 2-succinyl-6-hydroxy-2,4-cyclohexadiene-1-carboxylate synthase [Cytobacillus sp. IB215665]
MKIELNSVLYNIEIVGEGPPLILLHGFTGSTKSWQPFIRKWGAKSTLYLIDIIGHGDTASPLDSNRYNMESIVLDLVQLLNNFHITKANILGYSMGGRIALSLAMLYPERVDKLILESSSPGLATEQERLLRKQSDEHLAEAIEQYGMEWFVDKWTNLPLFHNMKQLPVQTQELIRQQRLENNPIGLANSLRGFGTGVQPSWWDKLSSFPHQTLLITGMDDTKFHNIAKKMVKLLPYVKWEKINHAGHTIHVEQPRIFGKIVYEFL